MDVRRPVIIAQTRIAHAFGQKACQRLRAAAIDEQARLRQMATRIQQHQMQLMAEQTGIGRHLDRSG